MEDKEMRCNQSDITQNSLVRTFGGKEYFISEVSYYCGKGTIRTTKKVAINLQTKKRVYVSQIYYQIRTVFDKRTNKVIAKRKTENSELRYI